jgi:polyisoprenoid-binding protein YceI
VKPLKAIKMKKNLALLVAIIMGISFLCEAQTISSEKSMVEFKVTNLGANKVKGTIKGMKGKVTFDPKAPQKASFDVCIEVVSINTKNQKRDAKLRGPEYFDAENYPEICFKSTSVEANGMSYKAKGKLSMHGESKPVEILFNHYRNTFTGKLKINRMDYKLGPQKAILVGKMVELTITCVLE